MDKSIDSIETYILNRKMGGLVLFFKMIAGTSLSLFLSLHFQNKAIGYIGFLIFFIFPLITIKLTRKRFTKNVIVQLTEFYFSIIIFPNDNTKSQKINEYLWSDIKSYRINFPTIDTVAFNFEFNNGSNIEYTFLDTTNSGSAFESLIDKFHSAIETFNNTESDNKIALIPSFLGSKKGYYSLIGVTILLIIAIGLNILLQPKYIAVTLLIGIILYIQIITKRKKDLEFYNKYK